MLYGEVVGRFITAIADNEDIDTDPNFEPLQGSVIFTLNIPRVADPNPSPRVVISTPITAPLDAQGYVSTPSPSGAAAYPGIYLMATNDPSLNPTNLTYTVSYRLTYKGVAIPLPDHIIALPAGAVVDLATVIPPESAAPIGVAAAEAAAAAAVTAANSAARVVIVNSGSEARPAGATMVIWVDLRVSPTSAPTNAVTNDIVLRPL